MYIHPMRTIHHLFAVLIVMALAAPWTAPLCSPSNTTGMPCCKAQRACDLRLQANRCCSIEHQPAAPSGPAGAPTTSSVSPPLHRLQIADVREGIVESGGLVAHLGGDRLWYPPAHDQSVPLFLRNASILR